jgi:hypothetical protein
MCSKDTLALKDDAYLAVGSRTYFKLFEKLIAVL